MKTLKNIEEIKEDLKSWNLAFEDLTEEELVQLDNEIEIEKKSGFVLDGIRSVYHEKWYRKIARQ